MTSRIRWLALAALAALSAGAPIPAQAGAQAGAPAGTSAKETPAAPAAATTATGQKSALPFIEDDYARALADAKARHVPLFVEAWAPW